jgi:hypothetical protein
VPLGTLPFIKEGQGAYLFHFWGDVYGLWLSALLEQHYGYQTTEGAVAKYWNEFCLHLNFHLLSLPPWDSFLAKQALKTISPNLLPLLELGRFHELLPAKLSEKTLLEHVNIAQFEALYKKVSLLNAPTSLAQNLIDFL